MYLNARALLTFLLLALALSGKAQQFGGNPPSIRWKQINTDTVRVIFPDGLQKLAADVANIAQRLGVTQSTLGNRQRKINIVLQNQTILSNGYVGLGPYRSEFYMTPLQNSFDLGSLPWHHQLALHEYRHVQQFNNFRKGVSKFFFVLAGELGVSFANNAALPNWFWEGDAVYQETLMSRQGRGRLPHFFNGYRSLWAADKNYSWLKLRNGSLRDYIPNHYQLGYLLSAYGREKYGEAIWAKVTDDAVRFKGIFYPFQSAIKRHTGISYPQFRKDALRFFESQLPSQKDSAATYAEGKKHFAGDVEYPQWIDHENIVLVKSSYQRIPAFYIQNIVTGETRKIRTKDISADNYFSYRNNRVVYAAYDVDLRWGWRDYGEIRLLDINSGEQRSISRNSKYFAPDISQEGDKIIAVEVLPGGASSLCLIDALNGHLINKVPNKEQVFFTYPKFYNNDRVVSAARNAKGEMSIGLVNLNSGDIQWLLPFSMNVIGFPSVQGDTILFTASQGERDRLFALVNERLYQFDTRTNSTTGSYQPSLLEGKLVWSDFTAAGHKLSVAPVSDQHLEQIDPASFARPLPLFGINAVEKGNFLFEGPAAQYPVKKYSTGHQLFRVHSWIPSISDPDYMVSVISENILNTLQSELYFNYNTNEKSKKLGFAGAYGGWYPWLRLGGAYTMDRSFVYGGNLVQFDEWEARGGVLLPLNLMEGRLYNSLSAGTDYVYAKPQYQGNYKDTFDNNGYGYINTYLNFSSQIQKARQHIYPRLAQTLRLDFRKAITSVSGNQFLANGLLYFPGLHVNHNLVLNLAFQRRDTMLNIIFTNSFPFSRGYYERNFHQMYKLGANYHLPLLYPDWGFGSIVYFLRIRGNAFFDMTRIRDYNTARQLVTRDFNSYGAEIFFDTKWWNQHPVSFGLRYSRLLNGELQSLGPNQFEFILPVNLIGR